MKSKIERKLEFELHHLYNLRQMHKDDIEIMEHYDRRYQSKRLEYWEKIGKCPPDIYIVKHISQ